MKEFSHLNSHSAFSFGFGPSSVASLVLRAAESGMLSVALTDINSVTGIPELTRRCEKAGMKPIAGVEVILEGGAHLTLLADGPTGFSSLCQLLSSSGLRDVERKGLRVRWEELELFSEGIVCLTGAPPWGLIPSLLMHRRWQEAEATLHRLLGIYGYGNVIIEVVRSHIEGEHELSLHLFDLADQFSLPAVATNAVAFGVKDEFLAHEALRRVALGVPIGNEDGRLPLNGERYLKEAGELQFLFRDRPDALRNAVELAERLEPPLNPTVRHYPRYSKLPAGESAFSYLTGLVWAGAKRRGVTDTNRLIHELEVVHDLDYADYFLVCHQVIMEARRRGIGCALRGSAIGSAALYAMGISDHDPIERRVSFERFLSRARKKPPDVDIDFQHDRRDELQEWLREEFGREHVANVANYVTYRGRSLLRDLGKALALDGSEIDRLRELLWHSSGENLAERVQSLPELKALNLDPELYGDLFALCGQLARSPRHLGTHSSGVVVSDIPVAEVAPVLWAGKGVSLVAFDKDDVEAKGIGFLKFDQLCLRALTAVTIATERLKESEPGFDYEGRDREDGETLGMIRAAQTIGVFQLESPAQMALQWRLKADKFDDLIHAVALIRPGPLVGGAVGPYIAVRHGRWKPRYPHPDLAKVLDETCGRILFQDQVLDVIAVVGGLSPDEADRFLKLMTHARNQEEMGQLGRELREKAKAQGISYRAFGNLWKQIMGFSRYGFCHGHSVAFADHAQGTAYLLKHYPAQFFAAILSVEPCGFWPISTVVEEAKRRGVTVQGPSLNHSHPTKWQAEGMTIRSPLSYVKSVSEELAEVIQSEREQGEFQTFRDACRRLEFVPRESLEWLILAGAIDDLVSSRRRAIWSLPALHKPPNRKVPTVPGQQAAKLEIAPQLPPELPDFTHWEKERQEWKALSFSPIGHPMRRFRNALTADGILPCAALQNIQNGERVALAGISIHPHRPPVPSGEIVVFLSLEDESGMAQVTVPTQVYQASGSVIVTERLLTIEGRATRRGDGIILLAEKVVACRANET